jgi:hypothetical protein
MRSDPQTSDWVTQPTAWAGRMARFPLFLWRSLRPNALTLLLRYLAQDAGGAAGGRPADGAALEAGQGGLAPDSRPVLTTPKT